MAVWGFGAYYNGSKVKNKEQDFVSKGYAFVGWDEKDAPALYRMLDSIKAGDIVYIKAFVPKSKKLTIKAVGIVTDTHKKIDKDLGTGIKVKWKKEGFEPFTKDITDEMYRNNVFNNTLYEEYNEKIINTLIDRLL